MAKMFHFFKTRINLTFGVLGVLIFMLVVGSLIIGINFSLNRINEVFESGTTTSTVVSHFDLAGYREIFGTSTAQ